MNVKKTCITGLLAFGMGTFASAATIIAQTAFDNDSGTGNWGQELRLDSAEAGITASSYTLDDFTFYTGSGSGGGSALFLDVYLADTAAEADNDFSSSLAGLTYLGSSSNSVDYSASSGGDALVWSFSGITIPVDRDFFVVISDDNADGSFLGASMDIEGANNGQVYTNITDANSDPIFNAGDGGPFDNDNRFTSTFTAVPEPGTLALVGIALGALLVFRRRR